MPLDVGEGPRTISGKTSFLTPDTQGNFQPYKNTIKSIDICVVVGCYRIVKPLSERQKPYFQKHKKS